MELSDESRWKKNKVSHTAFSVDNVLVYMDTMFVPLVTRNMKSAW